MGRISALTELTSLASNDYIVVLDSSANIAKKITVANAFGIPDLGWTAAGESWTYSAWSSTTRIAEITVPSNATTKYVAGMRVKFTQPTDGTKYGIIMKVDSTKLHVHMHASYDFDNESITSPTYTSVFAPVGFDLTPSNWTRESLSTTDVNQAPSGVNVWYNLNSHNLSLGVGKWKIRHQGMYGADRAGAGRTDMRVALSTSASSISDNKLVIGQATGNGNLFSATPFDIADEVNLTAATTYYAIAAASATGLALLYKFAAVANLGGNHTIKAVNGYIG